MPMKDSNQPRTALVIRFKCTCKCFFINEPRHEKTGFLHICENKDADQLSGNREADQRLCFRFTESTAPLFLNSKFQVSSHLQWLYSPVYVGPGRKPRRPVFSQRGSNCFSQRVARRTVFQFSSKSVVLPCSVSMNHVDQVSISGV